MNFKQAEMHEKITSGAVLKMLRELQGLSQNDLAQPTNMSQSNISAIENGAKQMGRTRAMVLAKALHGFRNLENYRIRVRVLCA